MKASVVDDFNDDFWRKFIIIIMCYYAIILL